MKKIGYILCSVLCITAMAAGCGKGNESQGPSVPTGALQGSVTPDPVLTPGLTETPSEAPTETPTVAPTETPTIAPTETEAPTATPEPTKEPTKAPTATNPPKQEYTYTGMGFKEFWTTANLNMRTLPDKSGEVIALAPKGSKVIVIRKCNETGWYEVEYNEKTGFMSNDYLTEQAPVTPTTAPATETPTATPTTAVTEMPSATATPTTAPTAAPEATTAPTTVPTPTQTAQEQESYLIVIDPGHQRKANSEKEPVGPGATEMKAKVSSGTSGDFTGLAEYILNLNVSFFIKEELESRGYSVVMTREVNSVDISNAERAQIANTLKADAFIRVHANNTSDATVEGVETLCQTKENPYNGSLYEESRRLSELVLEEVVEETGAKKRRIWETDTMTGINWAMVPTTILEMGYMSNEKEDRLMATEEYQRKIAKGVADAIDRYFGRD